MLSCSYCSAAPPAQHKLLEGALARRARVVAALLLFEVSREKSKREVQSFFRK